MADNKRAIYAEDLLEALRDDPHINGTNFARVKRHVNEMPTIDAVEVVRCKNCRRCGVYTSGNLYCTHPNGLADPKPDDFCSYGERREGE